jgi:hypothetical protein
MSSGKENESFVIVLTENGKYDNGVVLTIDDKTPVTIENVRKVKQQRKAEVVKTTPGKHNLKIMRNGSIVYNQDVLMGLQETKKIILP